MEQRRKEANSLTDCREELRMDRVICTAVSVAMLASAIVPSGRSTGNRKDDDVDDCDGSNNTWPLHAKKRREKNTNTKSA